MIVELARDGAVDRNLRADPPPSVKSGRVVLDHIETDESGRLDPPPAGEVILTVLSPEALRGTGRWSKASSARPTPVMSRR